MKKAELAAQVAETTDLSAKDAAKAVDATFAAIVKAMQDGDEVRITNFGVFAVSERPESQGRDPRSGAAITIKAAKVPKFRPGKPLKDALNA
ncbi:HU family DNA-binding protein [Acuticoccus sp. 2012]|uniref:HU family DNA-binding protein n=2 Tax=Acuticoccus mangrovi TaxID=2796142 RepID=A0A934IIY6_9HYPH|nr:HU family DNA-binding protein [Acuticoccus mangrovi]